jgi:hypothetical protein
MSRLFVHLGLAMIVSTVTSLSTHAQPGRKDVPKALQPELISALKKAEVRHGWWGYTDTWDPDYHSDPQGKPGSVLSLTFNDARVPGAIAKLPVADQEFGLILSDVTDADLRGSDKTLVFRKDHGLESENRLHKQPRSSRRCELRAGDHNELACVLDL